jgi:SmpA/OmlA family protein
VTRRRTDFLLFGGLGIAVFSALFWIQVHWRELAARLMGQDRMSFADPPQWIRVLNWGISGLPWFACAGLLVLAIWKRRWMPLLAFGGAQVLGVASILAVIFGGPVVRDYAARVPFDSPRWKAENGHDARGVRVNMVDDLLHRHRLVGMPRDKVDELLGVPPATEYFREYDYVYWLGRERGPFAIDSEWLVLKFKENAVAEAVVVTD